MCTRLIMSSLVANQVGLVVLYNSSKDVSGLDSLVRANFLQEDDFWFLLTTILAMTRFKS